MGDERVADNIRSRREEAFGRATETDREVVLEREHNQLYCLLFASRTPSSPGAISKPTKPPGLNSQPTNWLDTETAPLNEFSLNHVSLDHLPIVYLPSPRYRTTNKVVVMSNVVARGL
jgi:hypothetical protein